MHRNYGGIAAAASMAAVLGMSALGRHSRTPERPKWVDRMSIDEVEAVWVGERMRVLRIRRKRVALVVQELARAFGPWAHRFGYGPHPGNRERARRLRQQAAREAKRRK